VAVGGVIITLRNTTELLLLSEDPEQNKHQNLRLIVRLTAVLRKRKRPSI